MTRAEILREVNAVFVRVFCNPAVVVNEATTARDIAEWDSLNHTLMLAEVQERFRVKFSLREVLRFQNVGDICAAIEAKLPR